MALSKRPLLWGHSLLLVLDLCVQSDALELRRCEEEPWESWWADPPEKNPYIIRYKKTYSNFLLPVDPGSVSLIWWEGNLGEHECEFLLELSSPLCLSSSSTRRCLLKGFLRWSRIRNVTGHSKCKSIAIDPWLPLPCKESWLTLNKSNKLKWTHFSKNTYFIFPCINFDGLHPELIFNNSFSCFSICGKLLRAERNEPWNLLSIIQLDRYVVCLYKFVLFLFNMLIYNFVYESRWRLNEMGSSVTSSGKYHWWVIKLHE